MFKYTMSCKHGCLPIDDVSRLPEIFDKLISNFEKLSPIEYPVLPNTLTFTSVEDFTYTINFQDRHHHTALIRLLTTIFTLRLKMLPSLTMITF